MNVLLRCVLLLAACVGTLTANAESRPKLGVLGDSLSDEYFEDSTRAYAQNWLQQLATARIVDPGPTAVAAGQPQGTWGPPRQTGYAYNWAGVRPPWRSLVDSEQVTGLTAQVVADGIDCTVLAIGGNDFNPYSLAYAGIYYGTWSAARIRAQERRTLATIRTALVAVRRTGVPVILANVLDSGSTPALATFPLSADAIKRQRVTTVLSDLNRQLRQLAQTYQIPLVDWFGLEQSLAGTPTNLMPVLRLGNTPIMMQQTDPGPGPSSNPTAGYVADGFHPHTTIQGIFANTIIAALNSGDNAKLPFFTEAEILQHAGLPYGGADTLLTRIGSYTNYVFLPVPLGPTGSFQFTFQATNAAQNPPANWRLQIDLWSKVNARNAIPNLVATAQLIRPDGDTIVFPETPPRSSWKSGYTLAFKHGTNVTLTPPRLDGQATLVICNLTFIQTNGNWHPSGGKITYRHGTKDLSGIVD